MLVDHVHHLSVVIWTVVASKVSKDKDTLNLGVDLNYLGFNFIEFVFVTAHYEKVEAKCS